MDHESTTPQFRQRKRPVVRPDALPRFIDGVGGIVPAVLLSSRMKWNGDGFDGLDEVAVQQVNWTLAVILRTVLGEVDMQKLQKHLSEQAKNAIKQAADKMLKNKTARDIVVEEVAADPVAVTQATRKMLKNKTARDIVAEEVAADPAAVTQATHKMLKNKTARDIVAEQVAADPKALEASVQSALASGKLAELLASLSPEEKEQIKMARE